MSARVASVDTRFIPTGVLASDTSTDRSEFQTYYPEGGVSGPTITFNIPASQAGFVSLSQSFISSLLTVAHSGGHLAITPWSNQTAPAEGFADCLWSNVQLYINGVDVSDSAPGTYPYAAFYRNALTKSQDWTTGGLTRFASVSGVVEDAAVTVFTQLAARSLATPAGWGAEFQGYALSDKAIGRVGVAGTIAGANWGAVSVVPAQDPALAYRQSKVAYNGGDGTGAPPTADLPKSEWITTPQIGLWQNRAFLPANVDIRLVLTKNADAFCLMGEPGSTANITWGVVGENSCRLMLKRVYAGSAMQEEFDRTILERPMRYNITRSRVTTRSAI